MQDVTSLVTVMKTQWQLPPPMVVFWAIGDAAHLSLSPKQASDFKRGLSEVFSKVPSAWLFTMGSELGVSQLVRSTVDAIETPPGKHPNPCIGVLPWGAISEHEHLLQNPQGNNYVYGTMEGLNTGRRDPRDIRIRLEKHHTHFVFVDDGSSGAQAFGSELAVRDKLFQGICSARVDAEPDNPAPPVFVVLVVGGGPATLKSVLDTLAQMKPVICVADSGGAAELIYDCVKSGLEEALLKASHPALRARATELLPQIIHSGMKASGANHTNLLSFCRSDNEGESDAESDMASLMLEAMLGDCEST
jgi:hypothetical protein